MNAQEEIKKIIERIEALETPKKIIERIEVLETRLRGLFGVKGGDMKKSTYDANKNGIVDNAEKLEGSTKNQVRDHTPKSHVHDDRYYTEPEVDDLIPPKTNTKEYEAGEDLAIRKLCSRGHETTVNGETILRDSYVSEITGEQDTNFGSQTIMRVEQDAISHFTKGVIWFDISALPAGGDVDSVKLKFYVSNVNNLGGADYMVVGTKRVTATWVENTITWNNKPGEGGEYGYSANINSVGWKEVDITSLYKQWKAGTYPNYGVWLYGKEYSITDLPAYCDINSKEAASYKPYLYITYRGDKTKVYKAKATNWMGLHLAGFNTSAKTQGQTATIQSSGSLDGFSLTEGATYYASDTPGAISTSPGTVRKIIGKALSSSVLLILLGEELPGEFIAGDILFAAANTERYISTQGSWIKKKAITVYKGGTLRIKFDGRRNVNITGKARVYKNGSPIGIERTLTTSYATYSEDIAGWLPGDVVQLYLYKTGGNAGYRVDCKSFQIRVNQWDNAVVGID